MNAYICPRCQGNQQEGGPIVSTKSEAALMAQAIIEAHDGQAYFNFEEASKIIGCGRNTVAHRLHNAGITIKR